MVKIPLEGKKADATPVEVKSSEEGWNYYELEDGKKLKVKLIVANVYRLKGKKDDRGRPIYVIKHKVLLDFKEK